MSQITGTPTYITQSPEEVFVVAHLRGDLHYVPQCAICRAEKRATDAEQMVENIISGTSYTAATAPTPVVQTCDVCDPMADCRRACSARTV